tara:strand:- start:7916 stop:8281 length:366 start_codon:yes stop_codon:yes gene_type:complete
MANPNIVTATSIEAKVATFLLTTAGANSTVTNSANSGKVFKINSIVACNISTNLRTVRVLYATDGGSILLNIVRDHDLPAQTTLTLISSDTPIYLTEGHRLQCRANANNLVTLTVSYEEIS